MWNLYYRQSINVGLLKERLESQEIIVNNDTEFPTRLVSLGISIIRLDLTCPGIDSLQI